MNFASMLQMAGQVIGLLGQARSQFEHLKSNFEEAKDTLSETEVAELRAKLEEIHKANLALSQELDDNLAALQARG